MKDWCQFILWTGIIFAYSCPILTRGDILDHWTTNEVPISPYGLDGIVYGNGVFVAVAQWDQRDQAIIYSSADGYSWTPRATNGWWGLRMAFANVTYGRFCGVDTAGNACTSADGASWTFFSSPSGFSAPSEITFAIPIGILRTYVMVGPSAGDTSGSGGYIYRRTSLGTSWSSCTILPAAKGRINSVAYGYVSSADPNPANQNRFVAIGNNDGYTYVSTNGDTWVQHEIIGGNTVNFANGMFIVPFNLETNLISNDGINWTPVRSGTTNDLGKFTYCHGIYMTTHGGTLSTSSDGTNWVSYPNFIPSGWSKFGNANVACDGTRLLCVSSELGSTGDYYTNNLVYISEPLVDLWATNVPSCQLALAGLVGWNYQIQSTDKFTGNSTDWRTNATLQLPSTPYLWTDSNATSSARFYRAVLLP